MDYQYFDEPDYIDVDDIGDAIADSFRGLHSHFQSDINSLSERLWDSYDNCVLPSLTQIINYLTPLLICCLLCRMLNTVYARCRFGSTDAPNAACWEPNSLHVAPLHIISALCGLIMLHLTLRERLGIFCVLSSVSYGLLQLVRLGSGRKAAIAITVLTIGSQFAYELLIWRQHNTWPQLRGLQMVANMKVISLAFDLAETQTAATFMPNPFAYFGYIFSPATCVLGPWVSYGRYLECLCPSGTVWMRVVTYVVLNVMLCLLSLAMSNCIAPGLGEFNSGHYAGALAHWLLMYTGALSVRSSHYFVSFLSQALLAASSQQLDGNDTNSTVLGALVTRPWNIEWPYSLSTLVRSWNVPMHEWLKRYIYTASRQALRDNIIIAVFVTYMVSSLLHGMDFRIYLVLLSLASFANGEVMLRQCMANFTNACIAANPCAGAQSCPYAYCSQRYGWRCCSSWLVAFVNAGFRLLTMLHLAYLGVLLLNETLTSDVDLPFLWHWSSAGYFSHYIGLGTFILYLFIS